MRHARALLTALLAACSGGKADADSAAGPPTIEIVQAQVFTPSCAFATCHASPGASGLVLEDGLSSAALVNVDSADNPGHLFVVPGDSEGSYLIAKLRGDAGIVGDPMPVGAALEADRLQLVIDWIDAGAP